MLRIGQIVCPHGVGGEVRVMPWTDFPERFRNLKTVTLCKGSLKQDLAVVGAREHKNIVLLRFAGVIDRNQAEGLRGWEVVIPVDQAYPLPPGHYYDYQLEGLKVIDMEGNRILGTVAEVLHLPANPVYRVVGPRGNDLYIPALKSVVKDIDLSRGQILIMPLAGLLE